jgi:hypothetical protein
VLAAEEVGGRLDTLSQIAQVPRISHRLSWPRTWFSEYNQRAT